MEYFTIGETGLSWLKSKDEKLKRLIDAAPRPVRKVNPDPFSALADSIISQQVSGAAARSITGRLVSRLGQISPEAVLNSADEELISCGLGRRKTAYIKNIAVAAAAGGMEKERFASMSDAEIVKTLTVFPGVGEWTAQMFLIFCLMRPDVLSFKDFGIRRGLMSLYGLSEITPLQFETFRERYSPYGTTASFYLWEIKV